MAHKKRAVYVLVSLYKSKQGKAMITLKIVDLIRETGYVTESQAQEIETLINAELSIKVCKNCKYFNKRGDTRGVCTTLNTTCHIDWYCGDWRNKIDITP